MCINDSAGYVYCFTDGVDYKIGKTKDIHSRHAALNTGNKVNLRLVCAVLVHDRHAFETRVHKIFAANKIRREWFRLDEKDLLLLKKIFGVVPTSDKEKQQLRLLGLEV